MTTSLFGEPDEQTMKVAASALDDLFEASRRYRGSERFKELLSFICRFRRYSPFNGFLLHMQRPNVSFVATPQHWRKEFNRTIKDGAHPLVILAPMSPVLFVFDAADTEGDPLPTELLKPFAVEGPLPARVWERTIANLPRDRIKFIEKEMGFLKAGFIRETGDGEFILVENRAEKALYRLQINSVLDLGAKYATLAHEPGHLYAGHLGAPDDGVALSP